MIDYSEYTLANGLRVVANRDRLSELAAVNMLYGVGARNEEPERTGFAHLFEHLMFRGTRLVPDFDGPVQVACGENNAFTNNDYTDYYMTLPKDNIQTALWLESDRMTGLDITPEKLAAEKSVVIEEYKQRYLNQPYGDQWLLLRALAYGVHPYRWPTIGLTPDHIREATMADVTAFYRRYYVPSNAVLAVSGDLDPERVFELAEKWFGELESVPAPADRFPQEPLQREARREEVVRDVPATQVTVALHMGGRLSPDYYCCDVMTDLLAGGTSARLYRELVKRRHLFSAVNAYITGDIDPGLFILTGQLMPGVEVSEGEEALWGELERLCREPVADDELQKVRNKFEANMLYGEMNVMNKALNLAYYAMLGELELVNAELDHYRAVDAARIGETARRLFRREGSSTLVIYGNHGK
jgi:predicted Zn-dependent peptidase